MKLIKGECSIVFMFFLLLFSQCPFTNVIVSPSVKLQAPQRATPGVILQCEQIKIELIS